MKMDGVRRWVGRLVEPEVRRRVGLAVTALDDARDRALLEGDRARYDRAGHDRDTLLAEALEAWRVNPLARRIVELTGQYVVGGGLAIECPHEASHRFLQAWWNHRLNRMAVRAFELCDELTRTGNLFVALSTDAQGMSYVRAVPSSDVLEIEAAPNDVEQERVIYEKPRGGEGDQALPDGRLAGRAWAAYDEGSDGREADGSFAPAMLHYAVNRPVGAQWGESDLGPLLRWLARYAAWLEDRARLNRFRQTFLFVVQGSYRDHAERLRRQAEINANRPNPGAILVTDASETWSVLNPQLHSGEAGEDGLALKKMIAVGAGSPLHFLAEPEGSTRTTAESAGGPTFRHFEQRQMYFLWLVGDVARAALRRRAMVDRSVEADVEVVVRGTEISTRDHPAMAEAAAKVAQAFGGLRDRGLLDDAELLRMVYKFAGEAVDVEEVMKRGERGGEGSAKGRE